MKNVTLSNGQCSLKTSCFESSSPFDQKRHHAWAPQLNSKDHSRASGCSKKSNNGPPPSKGDKSNRAIHECTLGYKSIESKVARIGFSSFVAIVSQAT